MLAALLITLREGFEAVLILSALLGVLRGLQRTDQYRLVWWGAALAAGASVAIGLALRALGFAFEGRGEQVFEGLTMLLAALLLTWMILWMQRQGQSAQRSLEATALRASTTNRSAALFGLAFVAVIREGIETALFLTAAAVGSTPAQTLLGGGLGLLLAAGLGIAMFYAGKRLNVRALFRATALLLVLFAAGLLAHGVHELQEARLLPTLVAQVWDTGSALSEESALGGLLKSLLGYNSTPSLLEVIVYLAYFPLVWVVSSWLSARPRAAASGA